MACFLVPTAEALIVTAVEKTKEKKAETAAAAQEEQHDAPVIPFTRKLKWLTYLLWGGSVLLAFEHLWHGEIAPWFPFLTAMADPGDAAEMFHEMATVGVSMAVLITAVWGIMCRAADAIAAGKGSGKTGRSAA